MYFMYEMTFSTRRFRLATPNSAARAYQLAASGRGYRLGLDRARDTRLVIYQALYVDALVLQCCCALVRSVKTSEAARFRAYLLVL